MPRATAINAGEAVLLRQAIEDKFLRECSHVQFLKKNSYKESYRDLSNHMALVVPSLKYEFSVNRLRKLFYYTDPEKTKEGELLSFGEMFLEGCYQYISDGTKGRESYLNANYQGDTPSQGVKAEYVELLKLSKPKPVLWSGFGVMKWLNLKFVRGLIIGIVLGFLLGQEPRFFWWLFQQNHTWWVCEFEDGTLVYNDFRSYRSPEEVRAYFNGETKGDCDSFSLDPSSSNAKRVPMCFDSVNAQKNQLEHGGIAKIYQEP
ncbi:MAG: hypothetical protein AB8H47_14590 [Bacteroidia bacterium]